MQDIFGSSPKDIRNKHVYQKVIHQHQPLISFLIVYQGDGYKVVPLKAKVFFLNFNRWRKLYSPFSQFQTHGTLLRTGIAIG